MIHLALFLISTVFVLACIGGTFSIISEGFDRSFGDGCLALLGAGLVWLVVLGIVFL